METDASSLPALATALRNGDRTVRATVDGCLDRITAIEDDVRAWVDGPKPRVWLQSEATALAERYPDPETRPPLYGVPVGVKDIFHVDGLPTRAGSTLPPGALAGRQAALVTTYARRGRSSSARR